jgi:hypothetical protein
MASAVMGEAIEQRGCHFRIAEHAGPFAEAQIGRDDDTGALVELAQQVCPSSGILRQMAA